MIELQNRQIRLVAFVFGVPFLQELLTNGTGPTANAFLKRALPEGAKYVGGFFESQTFPTGVVLVFEHDSFEVVEEGACTPRKDVLFCTEVMDGSAI